VCHQRITFHVKKHENEKWHEKYEDEFLGCI
jgi:hypothetical protein